MEQQYVEALLGQDEALERIERSLVEAGMPSISVHPMVGRLLTMLVQMSGARRVLEIGALGGYSAICLARGGADVRITSLELKPEFAAVAAANIDREGAGDQVEHIIGDARESLKQLTGPYDLVFLDADKEGYPHYLDEAMRLGRAGTIIVGDNTLLRGRTLDRGKNGPAVLAMREFNRRMVQDDQLRGVMLPGFDGLAIAIYAPRVRSTAIAPR